MPKRSLMKKPEGKEPRGRMIRLYPTLDEKRHLRLVQDEARFAWNLLAGEYHAAVAAQFRKAETDGIIGPKPEKPASDAGHALWTEYYKTLSERKVKAQKHSPELRMPIPRTDKATYSRLIKAWEESPISKGKRRMTANMYQALIQDFAMAMIPKKGAIRWRPPRCRTDSDPMPIRTGSGIHVKPSGDKKRNALVNLPGLGWMLGICHRDLDLMVKSSMVEGIALREQTDGWYAAVRVWVPKPEPVVPRAGDVVGVDINLDYLAVCSDGKRWENPRSQVLDVALPKEGALPKIKRMPLSGLNGARIDNKWRESPERAHTRRARHVGQIIDCVVKHVANYRTVVLESEAPKVKLQKGEKQDAYVTAMGRLHTALRNRLGERLVMVEADFTSQECSHCGHRDKLAWTRKTGDGMHAVACKCPACGYVQDRDVNAARNLVRKWRDSQVAV
jgi:Transposase and inactivated derivatives